jgi:nitroreductase
MQFNSEEINRLMHTRRSVFAADYSGEKVDESMIKTLLENATQAPTHKLTEPWRFVVFMNEGIARLAEFQSACYEKVTKANDTFREERFKGLQTKPFQSSCIIAIGMKRDEKGVVPEIEEIGAVFCAIENMYLTAAAYGLGCYLSTGGITYFEEAKSFFHLGPADRLIGFLHLGIPKRWPEPRSRKPLEAVTQWVKS